MRSLPRTYMAYYHPSNFQSITAPVQITGMQLRLALNLNSGVAAGASWPSQPLTFNNYDIQLSGASATVNTAGEFPSSAATFASNQGGTITTVRSGSLTVPANSYTNNGTASPNEYGLLMNFTTPYLYTPGQELVVKIALDGYLPSTELQPFFASDDYAPNSRDAVSSTAGYNAAAPTGFTAPMFFQFTYAPVPEPASMLAVAAGVLGAGSFVRRRIFG